MRNLVSVSRERTKKILEEHIAAPQYDKQRQKTRSYCSHPG